MLSRGNLTIPSHIYELKLAIKLNGYWIGFHGHQHFLLSPHWKEGVISCFLKLSSLSIRLFLVLGDFVTTYSRTEGRKFTKVLLY